MTTSTQVSSGSGSTSAARRLSTGASGVLFAASSLRSLPRSQPPCTKVSLPSGRTSLMVACRSTFGADERSHAFTAPAPTITVSDFSGAVSQATAVPSGSGVHLYGGVAVHRPSVPEAVSPEKSVSGRARASQVNSFAPLSAGSDASVPPGATYHDRARVPGTGKRRKDFSKPGYGQPAFRLPAPL